MTSRPVCFVGLILAATWLSSSPAEAQQRFELDVPGNAALHSKAVVSGTTLTITGPDGAVTVYGRSPAHDTPGYVAYLWPEGRQFVRFPAAAGPMFTSRDGIAWRRSHMIVTPTGPAIVTPGPAGPAFAVSSHLDVQPVGAGVVVARIDDTGTLEFWEGGDVPWRRTGQFPNPQFVPGAPVKLARRAGAAFPTVFTVNRMGELLEVVNGVNAATLSPPGTPPEYSLQTHFAAGRSGKNRYVVAVRGDGRFFHLRDDGKAGIDNFGPVGDGIPLAVVHSAPSQLFYIDRFGKLRARTMGAWTDVPSVLGLPPDFQPGGHVDGIMATLAGAAVPTPHLATVNKLGQLQLVYDKGVGVWETETIAAGPLVPGQPVCIAELGGVIRVACCGPSGELLEFTGRPGSPWKAQSITTGLPQQAPVVFHKTGGRLFCFVVDRVGNLIIGQHQTGQWLFSLGSRGPELAARLVDRSVVPNKRASARLKLTNTFREPLRVEIQNLLEPTAPIELDIPVGGSVRQTVEIDTGATITDTYEIPVPGSVPKVDVRTYEQPALPSQKIVVWKAPVVSRIVNSDPKLARNIPDSERRGLVSLGVFVLPLIKDVSGETEVPVHELASQAGNPGAPEFQRRQQP